MSAYPWTTFIVLFVAGVFGALAVMPYAMSLNQAQVAKAPLSRPVLYLISVVQSAILIAIAAGFGLLAANAVGLHTPYIDSLLSGQAITPSQASILPVCVILGVLVGALIMGLEKVIFVPRLPEALAKADTRIAAWKGLLASFYGGIVEEILIRLLLMSVFAWLISRVWHTAAGLPTDGGYWLAIVLAALLFGLGHLPATKAITPLTRIVVVRALILNGIGGLIFGWLFWQYGLATAMIAHFTADLIIHVVTPMLNRAQEAKTITPATSS